MGEGGKKETMRPSFEQNQQYDYLTPALAQLLADAFQRRTPGSAQRGAFVKGRPAEDGHDRVDEEVAEGVAGVVPWHF